MAKIERMDVVIEVKVGLDFEDEGTFLSSFKIGDEEVDFGFKGMWLCDLENQGYVTFPRDAGKYKINAVYDEGLDTLVELHSVERIN